MNVKRAIALIEAIASELQSWKTVLRRAAVVTVALGVPAACQKGTLPLSFHAIVVAVSGASALLAALSWLKASRLRSLLLLPFSDRAIMSAFCIVGVGSVVLSNVVPFVAVLAVVRSISAADAFSLVAISVFSSVVVMSGASFFCVLVRLAPNVRRRSSGGTASVGTVDGANGRDFRVRRSSICDFVSFDYLLSSGAKDPRAWFSLAGVATFGLLASAYMLQKGTPFPVHSICLALTPPLSTLLSRDLHTRRQMIVIYDSASIAARYACALVAMVLPLVLLEDLALAPFVPVSLAFAFSSAVSYLVAAAVIVVLEVRFPLTEWKTENGLYLHPRKYCPPLAAALTAWILCIVS